MKAYKATDKDMKCLGFQYELNKEFVLNGSLKICETGFHFCKELKHVFLYYFLEPSHRFFEVEIPADAEIQSDHFKFVTNKIKFVKELSIEEIAELTDDLYSITKLDENNSIYYSNSDQAWYQNDKLHRVDGPAVIWANSSQAWWQNDKLHRIDGPAITYADGSQAWYLNGELHRVDGPAIICANGSQEWYQNDKLHRVDGPAITYTDGSQAWYLNGELHRVDGPAIIRADGHQVWYQNGNKVNK